LYNWKEEKIPPVVKLEPRKGGIGKKGRGEKRENNLERGNSLLWGDRRGGEVGVGKKKKKRQ